MIKIVENLEKLVNGIIQSQNAISYIKTKFFRYLVLIKKKTQNVTRELFQFVPLQDFSKPWTDEELYTKYGIDLFEREYIDSLIKPFLFYSLTVFRHPSTWCNHRNIRRINIACNINK